MPLAAYAHIESVKSLLYAYVEEAQLASIDFFRKEF